MIGARGRIIDPDDELPAEQPRCRYCGGFLSREPRRQKFVVGYPGDEFTEIREDWPCAKCGRTNYDLEV